MTPPETAATKAIDNKVDATKATEITDATKATDNKVDATKATETTDVTKAAETDITTLKDEIAEGYLDLLDEKKGGLFAVAGKINPLREKAKETLLAGTVSEKKEKKNVFDTMFETLTKNVKKKRGEVKEKLLGGESGILYPQKKIDAMAKKLASEDKTVLDQLKTDIVDNGIDPTDVVDPAGKVTPTVPEVTAPADNTKASITAPVLGGTVASTVAATSALSNKTDNTIEYADKTNRAKVTAAMNVLNAEDKKREAAGSKFGVPYARGKEGITGMDCSGMVDYVMAQAGADLTVSKKFATRNTTREYFKETNAQVVLAKDEVTTEAEGLALIKKEGRLKGLQKGDIVVRNGVSEAHKYGRSAMNYNNKDYYLHHIAIIEGVDEECGTISTLESNGAEGVTDAHSRNVRDILQGGDEFYVGKMDYNKYFTSTKSSAIT